MEDLKEKYKLARQHFFNNSLLSDLTNTSKFIKLLKQLELITSAGPTETTCYLPPEWFSEDAVAEVKDYIWDKIYEIFLLNKDSSLLDAIGNDESIGMYLDYYKVFQQSSYNLELDELVDIFKNAPELTEDNNVEGITYDIFGPGLQDIFFKNVYGETFYENMNNEDFLLNCTLLQFKEMDEDYAPELFADKFLKWVGILLMTEGTSSLVNCIVWYNVLKSEIELGNISLEEFDDIFSELILSLFMSEIALQIDINYTSEESDNMFAYIRNFAQYNSNFVFLLGNLKGKLYHIYCAQNVVFGVKIEDTNYIVVMLFGDTCKLIGYRASDDVFNTIFVNTI